jgi:hypothetical protein
MGDPEIHHGMNGIAQESSEHRRSGGVMDWVKGKIQKRNIAASMNNISLDDAEKVASAASGEPTDLDIAMGLENGGDIVIGGDEVADEDKIDLEAENNEGLLVGWGKKLQQVEWIQKTVEVVQAEVANRKEQEELREINEKYKEEIKKDPDIKALQKKIKKIKANLKVQRLNGDRIGKRNSFQRVKEQKELDKKTSRLQKAIWTFSNSSMNSHEYAKAMMRASARLQRKGMKVHKSEKALAMEAAVLRNMHRMLAIQKQYTMAKRACIDVESFIKRCRGWLNNKLADGEMGIMVLEATSKSMAILYAETLEIQLAIMPKMEDPKSHTFGKERMKSILALPKGLRSMPFFLKGPSKPPMKISLKNTATEDDDPNLKGYRTFKEQTKALEKAWEEELKQYENQLVIGGDGMQILDDVSELGDSEDEIEANLAAVSFGAAAAKKTATEIDLEELIKNKKGAENIEGENEDKQVQEKKTGEDADEKKAEEEGTANGSVNTGGAEPPSKAVIFDDSKDLSRKSADSLPLPIESAEEADAAALEEAQEAAKSGEVEHDPDVDEAALPEEVKQEDLENLLNKEADELAQDETDPNNAVEDALHQAMEEALEGLGAEIASDDDEEAEPVTTANGEPLDAPDDISC